MTHKDYCSKCKTKEVPLIKYAKNSHTQYYQCHDCNNKRSSAYRKTEKGMINTAKAFKKSYTKHHDRQKARVKVARALTVGKLQKPDSCVRCGISGRIQGHHTDYTKALEVVWLCISCHANQHRV